jgi:hypothetical protein
MEAMTQVEPGVTGAVMFYRQPEPLNKETHGALGMSPQQAPFAFTSEAHVLPLTVPEFTIAALTYPIIFIGDAKMPAAVAGVRQGQNLFVNAEGNYEPGAYVPAFVRRYPFVLAHNPGDEQMVVCIDRASPSISENAEVPFFENGEPTEFTKNAIQFCNEFEQQRVVTDSFIKLAKDLDLFETRQTAYTPRDQMGQPMGEPQLIAEYFAISETKLNALPAEKLVELRTNGALTVMYAQMISLNGWDKLIARATARANQDARVAANN